MAATLRERDRGRRHRKAGPTVGITLARFVQYSVFVSSILRSVRVALVTFGLLGAVPAAGQTITFEGSWWGAETPSTVVLPNGYSGFAWTNFWVIDRSYAPVSGFANVATSTSSATVAYNIFGATATMTSGTPFDLGALTLAAAWRSGLNVTLTGLDALGNPIAGATASYVVGQTAQMVTPNFTGVYGVQFSSSGGTDVPNAAGVGAQLAIDNLVLTSTVPEPSPIALLVVGMTALGVATHQRKR